MKTTLQQQQKLNIAMTPELRQAIELLQYSTAELEHYIREQEIENPLIELKEKENRDLSTTESLRSYPARQSAEWPLEALVGNEEITRDSLYSSAKLIYSDKSTQKLLKFLIYNLDDNGYLDLSGQPVPFSKDQIEAGILLLQKAGPTGIGARDLKECLLLQLQNLHPEETAAKKLVEQYLDLLAERKWKEISLKMKISLEEIKKIHQLIRTLHPKPCTFLGAFTLEYVIPDIIVATMNGQLTFKLNDSHLPDIQMNSFYSPVHRPKDNASSYLQTQFQKVQWLLNSIEQRRNTLIKIVSVLINRQEKFFKNGSSHLNPLTLKDVAEEIDMHESTVSRAVSNKVVQTAFGSFELKQLFPSKLTNAEGEEVSQTSVKSLIQVFISHEDKDKPYSDQKIADYLALCKGIPISRRTISKYREELKIPAASRRKEI
ncbi:RNA polymerase factor sigma-54 [Planomicrobium chinense]|uniref:RNA polymerase factor sigma-54 n=1 Tax=Planococcus chinensis TaxID=272917 RepID=UPI001CC5FF87|nr:RNA polymerase factor sigma-54 [Planococcus chinensis]MBZ5199920.1 RNA polymerase factor sigma-54 [Planococcus chinensis]